MNALLRSYMERAQARFSELDFAALGAAAADAVAAVPAAAPAPTDDKEQLRKLKQLHDEQLITDEEYEQKRKAILDRL